MIILAEEIYFLKDTSVEIWDFTGQLTAPFQLSQGRTYTRGTVAQDSVTLTDNAIFWVADDLNVYRSGAVPEDITTPYISDRLKACQASANRITALTFNIEGHVFYVMNLVPLNESYAYDVQMKEWARWGTQQKTQVDPGLYLGSCGAGQGASIFVGSYLDGRVFTVDETNRTDDGVAMRVVVGAVQWLPGGRARCSNISIACVRGVGTTETPNPLILMRFSDDGGRSFGSWMEASLGAHGQNFLKATWWALGQMQQPGRLFEIAVIDPVIVAIEGASINEPRP